MPTSDIGPSEFPSSARPPLGELLQRLHENLEQAREFGGKSEDQFAAWKKRWSNRREQITRRLETIDNQLASIVQERQPRPQLSVVGGTSHDTDPSK